MPATRNRSTAEPTAAASQQRAPARASRSAVKAKALPASAAVQPGGRLDAPTATARIVQAVTTAIVERRLMPGTKLVEQELAGIFQVSRTVVRQALNQLSRDKLVTLTPARGACVALPSVEEARQIFELRDMIERSMLKQLAARITPAQLAKLRAHLQAEAQAVQRTDVSGRTRLLADFHTLLARMLGNEVLAEVLHDLLLRGSLIALMVQSAHSAEASHAEHVAIVDALARGDGAAAARLNSRHLSHVEDNLRKHPRGRDLQQVLSQRDDAHTRAPPPRQATAKRAKSPSAAKARPAPALAPAPATHKAAPSPRPRRNAAV
jgi:DNA-binding GntR family transcriptional regulator